MAMIMLGVAVGWEAAQSREAAQTEAARAVADAASAYGVDSDAPLPAAP